MDELARATAITAARELLRCFKEEHPEWTSDCTPVDELAAWLGLQVATFHPQDYPPGTYGFLEPGEDLIWLCRDLSASLRRFTLAHELGHVVLHRAPAQQTTQLRRLNVAATPAPVHGASASLPLQTPDQDTQALSSTDPCLKPDVREEAQAITDLEQFEEVLGIGVSYDPRSQRELAANLFAAELLMPLAQIRALYLVERVAPATLAARFAVSHAAMLNRLVGLATDAGDHAASSEEPATIHHLAAPSPATQRRQYDEFQRAAIEAPTPTLIVAGPGSGKTSTLIGRVEYLVHTLAVPPEQILALTFSRKAAQEMQGRLQATLHAGDIAPAHAVPTVSTFHAFCADMLRTHGAHVGLRPDFSLLDEAEGYLLLRRQAQHLPLQQYWQLHDPAFYFADILRAISRAQDELIAPAQYRQLAQRMLDEARDDAEHTQALKALEVAAIYELYAGWLRERGDTDFGGLILLAVELLQQQPDVLNDIQQRYRHILVDEFQDMNRASGVLLRLLAGEARRVWVVGDANQAIYGFRGASPANIASFQQDYPGAVVLPLSRNYRSLPDIVSLAEYFRRRHMQPAEETELAQNAPARPDTTGVYITLAVADDNAAELSGMLADMRDKLAQGYSYQDIVVLCRTRSLARKVTAALVASGLPVIERTSMFEQEHIKGLLSLLLLLCDGGGMGILRAARQPEHPLAQADIEALLLGARAQGYPPGLLIYRGDAPVGMSQPGQRALLRLSAILQSLAQQADNVWSLLAHYLFVETASAQDLLAADTAAGQLILADYLALLALARKYDQQQQSERARQGLAEQIPPIQEQCRGFLDYVRVLAALGQEGASRQDVVVGHEEGGSIRVMTVHASKGLEFPLVYLPQLRQQNFPQKRHGTPVPPPLGMLPPECEGTRADDSGEACLFYVAITRARDELVLSYSERNGKQKAKPSQYFDALLAGIPAERIKQVRWQAASAPEEQNSLQDDTEDEAPTTALLSSQPGAAFLAAVKPPTLHAAAIETYQRCPRQYLYATLYGFEGEQSSYHLLWQATGKTLEALHVAAVGSDTQRPEQQESAQALYTRHWQELGGEDVPFAKLYERHGHEVVELLRQKLLASDAEWKLRSEFTVEMAGKTIHVTVDRVESAREDEAPVRFVRTRFGKSQEKPAAGTRELLYTHASRQRHPGRRVELLCHNLSTGETFPIKLTDKKEQSLINDLIQSVQALERDEYPPKPSPTLCPTCPFFLICPA